MNNCGSCSECCRLLEVKALRKPRLQQCRHADPAKGCAIYRTRPRACAGFECVWLESQRRTDGWAMPEEMRPDRSHVVMGPPDLPERTRLYVQVDPAHPNAWRDGKIGEYLRFLVDERGLELMIHVGEEAHRIRGQAMLSGTFAEFAALDGDAVAR